MEIKTDLLAVIYCNVTTTFDRLETDVWHCFTLHETHVLHGLTDFKGAPPGGVIHKQQAPD